MLRGRIALVCACLLACSSSEKRDARETYDYVLTPAGQNFRLIGAGPVLRGANTSLGLRITYVARAQTMAELLADADALVAALGPEMQLSGDKRLTVRARIGAASLALNSDKTAYDLAYKLQDGRFQRAGSEKPPPSIAGTQVPEDPAFPFRAEQLAAAATASAEWLALLDGDDLAAIRERVTRGFANAISDDGQLRQLLAQRKNAGLPGTRRELYRSQQRVQQKSRPPGADALLVYACEIPGRPETLERLVLARDANVWKIASYAFQPIPQ
jgi:hypothetical protein